MTREPPGRYRIPLTTSVKNSSASSAPNTSDLSILMYVYQGYADYPRSRLANREHHFDSYNALRDMQIFPLKKGIIEYIPKHSLPRFARYPDDFPRLVHSKLLFNRSSTRQCTFAIELEWAFLESQPLLSRCTDSVYHRCRRLLNFYLWPYFSDEVADRAGTERKLNELWNKKYLPVISLYRDQREIGLEISTSKCLAVKEKRTTSNIAAWR